MTSVIGMLHEGWMVVGRRIAPGFPKCVGQQLAQRDVLPRRRRLVQVEGRIVLQANLAILHQKHDRGGNELLAERSDPVLGLRRRRGIGFNVGHAISRGLDHLPVVQDRERQTWNVHLAHARLNICIDRSRRVLLRKEWEQELSGIRQKTIQDFQKRRFCLPQSLHCFPSCSMGRVVCSGLLVNFGKFISAL